MARSARAPLMRTKVWTRWLMGCLFAVWSELTLIREKFMEHPRFVYMLSNRHYAGYGCSNIGIRYWDTANRSLLNFSPLSMIRLPG